VGGVAPGLRPATAESKPGAPGAEGGAAPAAANPPRRAVSTSIELSSTVSIVADAINNSLLVKASPRDYKKILDALKQLDLVPLQVLVEATIIEIFLKGDLKYGVQWEFFGGKKDQRLDYSLVNNESGNIAKSFPGFNWAVIIPPDTVRATLSALAQDGLVNVLSSPSVMVLDNQTAKIQVGKQVPVATSQQQGLQTTDRVLNTIEYRDTGVQLSVKPRVTPGGLVQMEIEQEVSTVDEAASAGGLNSPTFSTRNITSNVAVRSAQSVVLGGLIQDLSNRGKQGIPGLYNIPVVGALFGETKKSAERTELVVILTPRVIASDQDVEAVTNDFRGRLKGLDARF
jgi:general secretion pathway protein D